MKKQDFAWGMKYGVVTAVFVTVLSLVASTDGSLGSGLTKLPVSGFAYGYLVSGVIAGFMLGAFRPLTRSIRGAALLGWLITIPCWAILALFVLGWSVPNRWLVLFLPGLLGGPPLGVAIWFVRRNASARRRT